MAKREEMLCVLHIALRGKEKEKLRYIENIPAREPRYTRASMMREIVTAGLKLLRFKDTAHAPYCFVQADDETKESRGSALEQEKLRFNVPRSMLLALNKAVRHVYPDLSDSYGRAKVIRRCISYYYDKKLEEERISQQKETTTTDQLSFDKTGYLESCNIVEVIKSIDDAIKVLNTVKKYFGGHIQ